MNDRNRLELRIKFHERSEKTATDLQAFCKACNKAVKIPHSCPIDGVRIVKIKPGRTGI